MVNDKIDKFIAGVAKIESWVRLVRVACLSFLEIVRCPIMLRFVRLMQLAVRSTSEYQSKCTLEVGG